jgi:DNA-directed RNA polymerase
MSSKDGTGCVRVVQAAHCIGEAVEREVSCLFTIMLFI